MKILTIVDLYYLFEELKLLTVPANKNLKFLDLLKELGIPVPRTLIEFLNNALARVRAISTEGPLSRDLQKILSFVSQFNSAKEALNKLEYGTVFKKPLLENAVFVTNVHQAKGLE